jgi:predicted esterase
VIAFEFARRAREQLLAGGLSVECHEFAGGHEIDPPHLALARTWLAATLADTPVS